MSSKQRHYSRIPNGEEEGIVDVNLHERGKLNYFFISYVVLLHVALISTLIYAWILQLQTTDYKLWDRELRASFHL